MGKTDFQSQLMWLKLSESFLGGLGEHVFYWHLVINSFFVTLLMPLFCHLCNFFYNHFNMSYLIRKKQIIVDWNLKSVLAYRTRVNLSNWSFNSKVAALVGLLLWAKQISWNFLRFLVLYVCNFSNINAGLLEEMWLKSF